MSHDEHAELAELSARGDTAAVAQRLDRHRARLKRMVAIHLDRRLAGRLDPSDIVQEGLAEAIKRLPRYVKERPVALYPWLRKLTWEKLLQMRQRHLDTQKRNPMREQSLDLPDESAAQLADQLVAQDASPSEDLSKREMRARVHEALAKLPPADRELLSMRYLEQMSVEEATEVLGISVDTFMKRHWRAMQRIRKLLEGIT